MQILLRAIENTSSGCFILAGAVYERMQRGSLVEKIQNLTESANSIKDLLPTHTFHVG
jgi:hypothetical protein